MAHRGFQSFSKLVSFSNQKRQAHQMRALCEGKEKVSLLLAKENKTHSDR